MNYKIIDNFLDKENFLKTKHLLEHAEFNWFYREYMVNKKTRIIFLTPFLIKVKNSA